MAIAFYISLSILLVLIVAWLIAEVRWSRVVRVALGLLCILYLCYQTWATAAVSDQRVMMHVECIDLIQRLLRDGETTTVGDAIDAYKKKFEATGDPGAAVTRMILDLQERDASDGGRKTAP
jgi:uncharacterized protein (DUF58 family)